MIFFGGLPSYNLSTLLKLLKVHDVASEKPDHSSLALVLLLSLNTSWSTTFLRGTTLTSINSLPNFVIVQVAAGDNASKIFCNDWKNHCASDDIFELWHTSEMRLTFGSCMIAFENSESLLSLALVSKSMSSAISTREHPLVR